MNNNLDMRILLSLVILLDDKCVSWFFLTLHAKLDTCMLRIAPCSQPGFTQLYTPANPRPTRGLR